MHINMTEAGCKADSITDDTAAIKRVLESLNDGACIYFPAGQYIVTEPLSIAANHIVICGQPNASCILYKKHQTEERRQSLMNFASGIHDVTVRDIKLSYEGDMFPDQGQSYDGRISGLSFCQCDRVKITNVEACGFNANGIEVITGNPQNYAHDFTVSGCYLHHNRVGGFVYGYVDGVLLTESVMEYNGSELDGGTGYGSAGAAGELPLNVQIIGNRANYNYRKGIDLHAGMSAVISGNICHANRLYGIYAEGAKTGNVIISNNIISGMNRKNTGCNMPYNWITGISVGPYSDNPEEGEHFNFTIDSNMIVGFGLKEQFSQAIHCYYSQKKGLIKITDNILRLGRVTAVIDCDSRLTPEENELRDVLFSISGNQVSAEESTETPFEITNYKCFSFTGNQIEIDKVGSKHILSLSGCSKSSCQVSGNTVRTEKGVCLVSDLTGTNIIQKDNIIF